MELMDKLRKLDHKLDEIKKAESRVMSNNSKVESVNKSLEKNQMYKYPHSHTNSQSELQKHEDAMKMLRKINEEKKERAERKNKKVENMMIAQQQ